MVIIFYSIVLFLYLSLSYANLVCVLLLFVLCLVSNVCTLYGLAKQNVDNKQIEFLVITFYVFALVIDYWSIKNSMLFEGGLE